MPLTRKQRLDHDTWLGVWKMDEPLDILPRPRHVDLGQYKTQRLREKLTEYALLGELTNVDGLMINHDEDGAPLVEGFHVSISHTKGWAAMIVSGSHRSGVDMEYMSDRVNRVASRFLRDDEPQDTLEGKLITWCAKEAAYKYYHEQHLGLLEMRLLPFAPQEKSVACLENLRQGSRTTVCYEVNHDYVLTFIME